MTRAADSKSTFDWQKLLLRTAAPSVAALATLTATPQSTPAQSGWKLFSRKPTAVQAPAPKTNGFAATVDRLMTESRRQAGEGRFDEAIRLAERARKIAEASSTVLGADPNCSPQSADKLVQELLALRDAAAAGATVAQQAPPATHPRVVARTPAAAAPTQPSRDPAPPVQPSVVALTPAQPRTEPPRQPQPERTAATAPARPRTESYGLQFGPIEPVASPPTRPDPVIARHSLQPAPSQVSPLPPVAVAHAGTLWTSATAIDRTPPTLEGFSIQGGDAPAELPQSLAAASGVAQPSTGESTGPLQFQSLLWGFGSSAFDPTLDPADVSVAMEADPAAAVDAFESGVEPGITDARFVLADPAPETTEEATTADSTSFAVSNAFAESADTEVRVFPADATWSDAQPSLDPAAEADGETSSGAEEATAQGVVAPTSYVTVREQLIPETAFAPAADPPAKSSQPAPVMLPAADPEEPLLSPPVWLRSGEAAQVRDVPSSASGSAVPEGAGGLVDQLARRWGVPASRLAAALAAVGVALFGAGLALLRLACRTRRPE